MSDQIKNNPYEKSYQDSYPDQSLYYHYFKEIPSAYTDETNSYLTEEILQHFIDLNFDYVSKVDKKMHEDWYFKYDLLIHRGNQLFVLIKNGEDDKPGTSKLSIFYNLNRGQLEKQFDITTIEKYISTSIVTKDMSILRIHQGSLQTHDFNFAKQDVNIELNYGKQFSKIHDNIVQRLNNQNDNGIVLLHGLPGTGKTTYIKYLSSLIENKKIMFIPPSMAESLSDPSLIPFLLKHKNSILIIEDAEKVIGDRETSGSSLGVSNILNLTDGILGECLNVQIIATFNMKREKIDPALLRKGRLIAEHKFEELSVDESNTLLKHLGKTQTVDQKMVLSDIYNIDQDDFKVSESGTKKIGF